MLLPRVSAQAAEIEGGRAAAGERSRENAAGADVSHCLGEKTLHSENRQPCIFSFPSPRPLSGNKSCTIMGWGSRGGASVKACAVRKTFSENLAISHKWFGIRSIKSASSMCVFFCLS